VRSLWVLARLWQAANEFPEPAMRPRLCFVLTSLYQRITRLSEYRFWGGSSNTANYYVPLIANEQNVPLTVRRKAKEIAKFYRDYASVRAPRVRISTQSATNLHRIPDASVDYIFTDPPFGGNINYSEMNLLWESWLGASSDRQDEAIVNRSQRKSVVDYERLMQGAMRETSRVLRPGRWMTLVFHNSSARVWRAIQGAVLANGFQIAAINVFDKVHGTEKMFSAENAVGFDVVLHCRKPVRRLLGLTDGSGARPLEVAEIVRSLLASLDTSLDEATSTARDERLLYSRVLAKCMERHRTVELDFAEFRRILQDHFRLIDGYVYLLDDSSAPTRAGRTKPYAGRNRS
jgi:adenine-specific DNA methylase